ncbi:Hsp20/alpha crystallin family protein [Desulfovibrio aminophilus]|nr:Hsp20/alpha crystallin family protein [Desulfovibrio aminophilus]MCM0754718.1 Hsp20/alpha crystallin family protein [Desulfovibrio aminophilus]
MFKWNPWADLEAMRAYMDRLWGESGAEARRGCLWSPAADVLETPSAYVLRVELPGVPLENVVLEAVGRELRISGRRPPERDFPGTAFHAVERPQGPFARAFALPPDADPEAVSAALKDGLLTVTIPRKRRAAGPRGG